MSLAKTILPRGNVSLEHAFDMDWKHRLPAGIGNVRDTPTGFVAAISIPVDDDGYFGRECPECGRLFKMDAAEYEALPDDLELICPYCGERRDHGDFMTRDQRARVDSAVEAVTEQYVHQSLNDMFHRTFSSMPRSPKGSFISIEWRYEPGRPPISRQLHDYLEDRVRRTLVCLRCDAHVAVYGATAFCPVCGPRHKAEEIKDAIAAQRLALALPDQLERDVREQARAAGVFDQHSETAIKDVVTLFETFMRGLFLMAVPNAEEALAKERGTVFQSLEDTVRLLRDYLGWDIRAAGPDVIDRLAVVFAKRHVLVHRKGEIDKRYLQRVPASGLRVGQHLTITRAEAERALNDLEALVDVLERQRASRIGRK